MAAPLEAAEATYFISAVGVPPAPPWAERDDVLEPLLLKAPLPPWLPSMLETLPPEAVPPAPPAPGLEAEAAPFPPLLPAVAVTVCPSKDNVVWLSPTVIETLLLGVK